EERAQGREGPAQRQRRQGRSRPVLGDVAPVERDGRAERERQRECECHRWKGRYVSAASAASETRGRSRRRSWARKPGSQRGKNLRLKLSRLSSWKCPFRRRSARRCSSCAPESSASGASSAAKGEKLSETRAYPCSRAQAIASQISHSLKPFGVAARTRGIDESESAETAGAMAKCRKPCARPSASRPITNTASSSPSGKSESRAIAKPGSGC